MKNIHTILSEFGVSVPEDKKTEFDRAVAENYKTAAEHEKKVSRLNDDLAAMTTRAETAEATLKGFEGKDFDAITRERDEWKQKHDQIIADHQKEQEDREFYADLDAAITEAKGKNPKAIKALLDIEALRKSRNRQKDILSALESLRSDSGYLFDDNGGQARFTDPKGNGGNGGGATITKKEIMAIKDDAERYRMIDQNRHLFIKKG